jgi:sporulation protein YlmC with PRC-barrel domain
MTRFLLPLVAALFAFTTLASGISRAEEKEAAAARSAAGGKVEVATNFRSSELIGMPVRNRAGTDIGKIEDFVVELNSGDVRYAAVSFGGFAGFGNKLFAVPWKAMAFKFGEDDRFFVFNATEQELEKAPGFDPNNWPDVADPAWSESIDKHYRLSRTDARADTTARADAPAEKPTVEKAKAPVIYDAVFRVSKIDGMTVRNKAGEDIGHVDELVFDIKSGKVKYSALSFGGFAGFGNKLFAIPMTAFTLKHGAEETFLVLDIDAERLKSAPGFDKEHWPDTADPNWAAEIDKFYPARTAERPATTAPRKE